MSLGGWHEVSEQPRLPVVVSSHQTRRKAGCIHYDIDRHETWFTFVIPNEEGPHEP